MTTNTTTLPPENPRLDKETLILLQSKVNDNKANSKDYALLDNNIAPLLGRANSIISTLEDNGFNSYEEFINERRKGINFRNPEVEGTILGTILGTISALKRVLNNQL